MVFKRQLPFSLNAHKDYLWLRIKLDRSRLVDTSDRSYERLMQCHSATELIEHTLYLVFLVSFEHAQTIVVITLFLFNALSLVRISFFICASCKSFTKKHLFPRVILRKSTRSTYSSHSNMAGATLGLAQDAEIPVAALPTTFVSDADSVNASSL